MILEKVGVDMSQEKFRDMVHLYLAQVCKVERDMYRRGKHYEDIDNDKEILGILLENKAREVMLS